LQFGVDVSLRETVAAEKVHLGIRVRLLDEALAFWQLQVVIGVSWRENGCRGESESE